MNEIPEKIAKVAHELTAADNFDRWYENGWTYLRGLLILAEPDEAKEGQRADPVVYDEYDVIDWYDSAVALRSGQAEEMTLYEALMECGYEPKDLA